MDYLYENEAYKKGYKAVCGIDEAGRGPLCGPVFAACVILKPDTIIEGINDSKKLSEKKREQLFDVICKGASAYAIASASAQEIDEINILNATFLAMRRAKDSMKTAPDFAYIDGNRIKGFDIDTCTVVKGDAKCISIAAASILAKVARDRYMKELSQCYPQYQLDKHKGYGTKLHYELIKQYGVTDIYRKSFLKNLNEK